MRKDLPGGEKDLLRREFELFRRINRLLQRITELFQRVNFLLRGVTELFQGINCGYLINIGILYGEGGLFGEKPGINRRWSVVLCLIARSTGHKIRQNCLKPKIKLGQKSEMVKTNKLTFKNIRLIYRTVGRKWRINGKENFGNRPGNN